MSRLGLPTKAQFKASTTPPSGGFAVKRMFTGRGSEMLLVDQALSEWDAVCGGTDQGRKIKALRGLSKACGLYLRSRIDKSSTLAIQRKAETRRVSDLAIAALGQLDAAEGAFASNKSKQAINGRMTGQTISLCGGYKHERTSYEQSGKTTAMAAGAVHPSMPNFDTGTYADYVNAYAVASKDENRSTDNQVYYLSKNDRMEFLAICQGGVFRRGNGTALQSVSTGFGVGDDARLADMWAMDRYGNLFVRDVATRKPRGVGAYFNHSSFCAGSDIVCAGSIMFNPGGVLVYLDNASGHYKPDADALRSTLNFLKDSGVRLANVRVGVINAAGAPVSYKAMTVLRTHGGVTAAVASDWAAADNAALHLPSGPISA